MEGFTKRLTKDLLYCFKLSIYYFIVPCIIGMIVGLIQYGLNLKEMLLWGARLTLLFSCFGMGVAAISFSKPDLMRPLEYQREWEEYFGVLNLTMVILIISFIVVGYGFMLDFLVSNFI